MRQINNLSAMTTLDHVLALQNLVALHHSLARQSTVADSAYPRQCPQTTRCRGGPLSLFANNAERMSAGPVTFQNRVHSLRRYCLIVAV